MRQAAVFRKGILAGHLTENGGEYLFSYDESYLALRDAQPISLTLPLQEEAYVSPVLFPFFDGLIPEGWLLDVAIRNTDISIIRSYAWLTDDLDISPSALTALRMVR